jgi:hypothetical protein
MGAAIHPRLRSDAVKRGDPDWINRYDVRKRPRAVALLAGALSLGPGARLDPCGAVDWWFRESFVKSSRDHHGTGRAGSQPMGGDGRVVTATQCYGEGSYPPMIVE